MRIIGGEKKGLIISPPKGLPVRPTTDRAKESLFNILENRITINNIHVLDLFAGTGNISFEFASRGAQKVESVDADFGCVNFIKQKAKELGLTQVNATKKDVFSFLKNQQTPFQLIFADPPYALDKIRLLPQIIFENNLLTESGLLIIEHSTLTELSKEAYFAEKRVYGQSTFSFFEKH